MCHCNCHLKLLCVYCFDQNLGHDKHALKRISFQLYFDDLNSGGSLATFSPIPLFLFISILFSRTKQSSNKIAVANDSIHAEDLQRNKRDALLYAVNFETKLIFHNCSISFELKQIHSELAIDEQREGTNWLRLMAILQHFKNALDNIAAF